MDGKPWAVCDVAKKGISNNTSASYNHDLGFPELDLRCDKFFNGGDQALIMNIHFPKVGLISTKNPQYFYLNAEFFTELSSDKKGIYALDTSQYARLEVTKFDTIQRIISGRFECTLTTGWMGNKDTIKVTNGVFDARF
jgi:hypothetical protein